MKIKWIKLAADMFDDHKIQFIQAMPEGNAIIVFWIRLLCLCGKVNNGGLIAASTEIPYTPSTLSYLFREKEMIVELAISTLSKLKMIEIVEDGKIYIPNWEKHQNMEFMDRIREQNRLRKQSQRDRSRHKLLENKDDAEMSRDCHANVTVENKKENKNKRERDTSPKNKYGEHGLVSLSDDEFQRLGVKLGDDLPTYVSRLEKYIGSKGDKYKSHYFTILNWYGKDHETTTTTTNQKPARFVC